MPQLKDNRNRSSQAIFILKVIIIFDILMVVFDFLEYDLFLRISRNEEVGLLAIRRNEVRQLLTSIFYTTVSFCSGIAFIGWFYRAYSNISRSGNFKTSFNPSWAAWSFIIPVVNFYSPYRITLEIWNKYDLMIRGAGGDPVNRNKNPITLWWFFWILTVLMSISYLVLLILPSTKDKNLQLSVFSILSEIMDIPAAMCAIIMIRMIHHREKELMKILVKE
jgi:hypothetical protein